MKHTNATAHTWSEISATLVKVLTKKPNIQYRTPNTEFPNASCCRQPTAGVKPKKWTQGQASLSVVHEDHPNRNRDRYRNRDRQYKIFTGGCGVELIDFDFDIGY
jgi:hypothetical protein